MKLSVRPQENTFKSTTNPCFNNKSHKSDRNRSRKRFRKTCYAACWDLLNRKHNLNLKKNYRTTSLILCDSQLNYHDC